MGGGSALLINSNRRGGAGNSEFGCDGWFCDILDGAMMLLVVMIIATAIIGCLKACFHRRRRQLENEIEPKSTSEIRQVERCPEENVQELAPPTHSLTPVRICMENPPDYAENDLNSPPAYYTLRFDQQEVQI